MADINIPVLGNTKDIKELRAYIIRLTEEISNALSEPYSADEERLREIYLTASAASAATSELKSAVNMQSGLDEDGGYISFGGVTLAFGSAAVSSGSSAAVTLPCSYKSGYKAVVTLTGGDCKGADPYISDKGETGFKLNITGGSGQITADWMTIGIRTGG